MKLYVVDAEQYLAYYPQVCLLLERYLVVGRVAVALPFYPTIRTRVYYCYGSKGAV